MKRVFQILLFVFLVINLTNCRKKTHDILYDSKYKKQIITARNEASMYLRLNYIPGASFAVSIDGKIVYSEGMGLASKDLEVPATRKTKFRIGEISELFTSLIFHMMVEEGILHPDSTVQRYIPGYPPAMFRDTPNKITLNQLVNHSSGIRRERDDEFIWNGENIALQNSYDIFKNDNLDYTPGWFENPSAHNFNLLGAVMEKATGKSFAELLKTYVTDTLQLENTEIDNPFRTVIGRTDFYDLNFVSQIVNATFRDMRFRAPSEGILSNAGDLVKFGNAFLYSGVISDSIKSRMFKKTKLMGDFPPSLANGWFVSMNMKGETYFGKIGEVTGGGAVLLIIPDKKVVAAVTVNLTTSEEIPIFKIIAPFIEEPDETKDKGKNMQP